MVSNETGCPNTDGFADDENDMDDVAAVTCWMSGLVVALGKSVPKTYAAVMTCVPSDNALVSVPEL